MRSTRLSSLLFVLVASSAAVACGGGGGDDGGNNPDAAPADAAPDAAPALTGLGQRCGQGLPACPAGFNGCLVQNQGAVGICSKTCVASLMFTTNANNPPGIMTINPVPTSQNAACQAVYTGTVGTGTCEALLNIMPAPPLQPNTNYTAAAACVVKAGAGNACPQGLTFQMATGWCVPR